MSVTFQTTDLPGVVVLTPKRRTDERGWFAETYRDDWRECLPGCAPFIQDNQAHNRRIGTLRGLHFQAPPCAQAKLIRVLRGAIRDAAVDLRRTSDHFGRAFVIDLSAEDGRQLYIPKGFAHGYVTLTDETDVAYKVDAPYDPACVSGVAWDDPDIAIDWGFVDRTTLSEADGCWPRLAEETSPF